MLSPPVHALLYGTVVEETERRVYSPAKKLIKSPPKRREFIVLEKSGAQALSGEYIFAGFDDIEYVSSYQQFKWYDQNVYPNKIDFFKICPLNRLC